MPRTRSQPPEPLEPYEEEMAAPVRLSGVPPSVMGLLAAVVLLIVAVVLGGAIGGDLQIGPEPDLTIGFGGADDPAPPDPDAPAAAGTVLAGGDPILPIPPTGLGPYQGREVRATSVPVLSVVANEGFWVGQDQTDRLYVIIAPGPPAGAGEAGHDAVDASGPESPPDVDAGQLVSFVGTLETVPPELPPPFTLTAAEGADRLGELGFYIAVPAVTIDAPG